jgi:hypothetical protein
MIEITARVPTSNAGKYVMSLCRHWAHRMEVNVRDRQGVVHFENAVATLTPTEGQLVVTILANDGPTIERLQGAVSTHLDRFAFREAPLKFDWRHSADLPLHAL